MDAALEIVIAAASETDVDPAVIAVLQRESVPLVTELAARWQERPGREQAMYLWFPPRPIAASVLDEVERWLDEQPARPGLIAVGGLDDVEALLAAGVDDVITSATSGRELVARARALYRRLTRQPREGQLRFGVLAVNTVERTAWMEGVLVTLTPIEQAVLVTLIRARGQALSRLALLDAAWGESELEISERAVDNVVLRLRRKLPRPEVIETVRGVGFRLARDDGAGDHGLRNGAMPSRP